MPDSFETEDLYELKLPSDVALSPGGDRVAFIVRESVREDAEHRRSLYVAPTDGSREPHRLTRVSDASSPEWGPEGSRLAFIASRQRDVDLEVTDSEETDPEADDSDDSEGAADGEDEERSQIWTFDLDRGGDLRQVTDFDEGVDGFDWGPDGDRLVVSARDPTPEETAYLEEVREEDAPYEITRLQHKADGEGYLDDVRTYLFVVNFDSRETRRLDDASGVDPRGGLQPRWGPDGRIAYRAYYGDDPDRTHERDLHTIDPDGGDRRAVTAGGVSVTNPRWSPAGDRLSFVTGDPENVHVPSDYRVVDLETGHVRSVSASLDRTASWAGAAEWVGEGTLLATIADEGLTRLVRLDAAEDDPRPVFEAQGTDRTVRSFDATVSMSAVVLDHPSDGRNVFALETAAILENESDPTRLTRLNEDLLGQVATPSCERIRFENGDGENVEGLVYLPADFDPDEGPRPLIAHIHGGPTAHDAPGFDFDYAYWTGQGYVVLNVNYRGSTSYGRAFSEAIRGDWGPREADDILAGVEAVVDRGWADVERLFLRGFHRAESTRCT